MAQFDVYENQNQKTQEHYPYLLDVQDEILDILNTRVVIPLMPSATSPRPMDKLNPVFDIDGIRFIASAPELAGIPKSMLGQPVMNITSERGAMIAALDFLFMGI